MTPNDLGLGGEFVLLRHARNAENLFEHQALAQPTKAATALAPPVIESVARTRYDLQIPGTAICEAALDEGDGVARASSERGRPMPGLAGIVIAPPVCEPASSKSSHDLEVALCPERALDRGHPTANAASKEGARPMPLVVVTVPVMHELISIDCDDLTVALRAEV